ncbi:hypothetical protein PYW07_014270 [Mythimna separata]|uniref:Neural Wiskott-Aldrich syndrome protein n=1 Tax=Mythimna separata TaxID=271217 RepID=A0AAD8E077_MYTSE|nr:hypothetical protein PYW07_014270 [Mythimna separata]
MPRGENRASILLSPEENDQVFSLIGPKCQSLATAVVQLFTTEDPSHSKWKKKDTGVLCLIKDNGKRSYFFRIYCLYRKAMIWEQEVYLQIEYKNPRPFLHTFEAEEYMAAFNFANENEANILRNILLEKIELRKIRREERARARSMVSSRGSSSASVPSRQNGTLPPPPPQPEPAPAPVAPVPMPVHHAPQPMQPLPAKTNHSLGSYTLKSNKKQKGRKITKADIGMPQDFKHISHVGWNANTGFDLENAPEADELRCFFSKAGVSETQLQDQETREFIYDFIETHGGLPAVKQDLDKTLSRGALPPAPSAAAPPVPTRSPAPQHPPAPPSRAPPPPPARAVPPPPAHRVAPPRPAQPVSSGPPSVPPPPPPGTAPPPPPLSSAAPPMAPPPPPPPAPPAPPPAPPMAPDMPMSSESAAASADPRAALMESIRSGTKGLKRVEPAAKSAVVEDSRSNLLSEIRQGIELKAVSRSGSNSGSERKAGTACGLAEALQRALEERSRAIHSSDSDMSDATTSDGEWDD